MKRSWQIFWHVAIWVGLVAFFVFMWYNNNHRNFTAAAVLFVLFGGINISLFYFNYLVLIPHYLDKKKYKTYALLVLITIAVYGIGKLGVAIIFKPYVLERMKGEVISYGDYMISTVFVSLIFIFLSIVLQFSLDWFMNERVQRDLENQRLTAELSFLKSQINPHFLFNSLNTIYSLAYQRSETTPEAVLKLSEIMRYMLYECNDNKVDLEKELKYLQNYIDLQKIRFGNKAFVEYTVNGNVSHQRIVPLLLISFVENAFKHGVANDPDHPIILTLNVTDDHLDFYVYNKKHQHNRDAAGGIGLNNVQRRLNLLYPDKYKLNIQNGEDAYSCELSLVL